MIQRKRRRIKYRQHYHYAPLAVVQTVQSQLCVTAPSWQTARATHGQQLLHCVYAISAVSIKYSSVISMFSVPVSHTKFTLAHHLPWSCKLVLSCSSSHGFQSSCSRGDSSSEDHIADPSPLPKHGGSSAWKSQPTLTHLERGKEEKRKP